MNETVTDDFLRASIQWALKGNTPDTLLEVRFQNGPNIILEFVFDGPIQEDDRETASIAETEILSDLPTPLAVASDGRFIEMKDATPGLQVAFRRDSP